MSLLTDLSNLYKGCTQTAISSKHHIRGLKRGFVSSYPLCSQGVPFTDLRITWTNMITLCKTCQQPVGEPVDTLHRVNLCTILTGYSLVILLGSTSPNEHLSLGF